VKSENHKKVAAQNNSTRTSKKTTQLDSWVVKVGFENLFEQSPVGIKCESFL